MFSEVQLKHCGGGDLDSGVVVLWDQIGVDGEAGVGFGGADELEDFLHVSDGLASPVLADLAEPGVLNRIPLGSAGRVTAHGDGETERTVDPTLEQLWSRLLLGFFR